MTRCAYLGNFRHHWTTETHVARDMRNIGIEVGEYQEPDNSEDKHRWMVSFEQTMLAWKPDVVMFTRTWGLPPEATQMWRRLEDAGIITCSYHLDLYLGLKREEGLKNDPFWTTGTVFTPDGDPKSAERFKELGVNHHWISPAVVSDECYIGEWDERFDFDVVFVGSYGYHDEWPWRPRLIDYLSERYGDRFRRFGGDTINPVTGVNGPVRGRDLNNLYATARVVVGDSLCLPGHSSYWSDRYFETIGRGGVLLAPAIPGLKAFLDHRHFISYSHPSDDVSTEEALEQIGRWVNTLLVNNALREALRRDGQGHVARNHTYKHRLAQAFDIMGIRHGGVTEDFMAGGVMIHGEKATLAPEFLKPSSNRMPEWLNVPRGTVEYPPSPTLDLPIFIEKLELGAGRNKTPGFTSLDLNPATEPDIVGAAWPLDLPHESVGEIRAVDVLEHLPYTHTDEVLADWFRVLAPNGRIFIQLPDAETIMHWFVEQPHLLVERLPANALQTPLSGAVWRLFGGMDDDVYVEAGGDPRYNCHMAGFSAGSLRAAVEKAGFVVESLTRNNHPNLLMWCVRP